MAKVNNINNDKRETKDSNNSNKLRNISKGKNNINNNNQRRTANILDKKNKYNNNNNLNENDSKKINNQTSKEHASLFPIIKQLTYDIKNLSLFSNEQRKNNEKFVNFIDKQEKINEILLKRMEKHDKLLDNHLGGNNSNLNTSIKYINANKKQLKDRKNSHKKN